MRLSNPLMPANPTDGFACTLSPLFFPFEAGALLPLIFTTIGQTKFDLTVLRYNGRMNDKKESALPHRRFGSPGNERPETS